MRTERLLMLMVAGAAALSIKVAMAHGPEAPKFGGTTAASADLGFELASQGDTVTLYVDDHGKPLATSGGRGKLTVLDSTQKSVAELIPAAPNKLEAKGIKLNPGAKAVAEVTLPGKKVITVRFTVK
jgi:hypothetical protein